MSMHPAGSSCSKCLSSAKPDNSHFVQSGTKNFSCAFECDPYFEKSALNLCLTPFFLIFQIQMHFADLMAVQNIYRFAFAAAGSLLGVDSRDVEFIALTTSRLASGTPTSIRAKMLIDRTKLSGQKVESIFSMSRINEFLPKASNPIISISFIDVNVANISSNQSTGIGNGQSVQEGNSAISRVGLGLAIGLPLGACLILAYITIEIRRRFRTKLQIESSCVLTSSQLTHQTENCQENTTITPVDPIGDEQPIERPIFVRDEIVLQFSSDIPPDVPPIDLKSEHRDVAKHSVRQINFGDLQVQEEISQGSFKSVYRAVWRGGERNRQGEERDLTVALLVLRNGGGMAGEIDVFETLGCHPHLTRLLAITTDLSGRQCLITEYASRGSLDQVIQALADQQRVVSDMVLLTACMQICDGMEVLSEHRLIHRDLAARNVLVFSFDENYRRDVLVKISDYGLTVEGNYVQFSTSSVSGGVPMRWMPPEVREVLEQRFVLLKV
jgi:hypothetical protein